MRGIRGSVLAVLLLVSLAGGLRAEDPVAPAVPSEYPPPAATKLEAFQSPTGAVFTIAHEDLGTVQGVQVQVVEMRDEQGKAVRGIVLYLSDANGIKRSYVDADEVAGLLQACDKLLDVTSNPTSLRTYEARYVTRGSLQLTARTTERQGTVYSVRVGRFETAAKDGMGTVAMQQLRAIFTVAQEKLAALVQ